MEELKRLRKARGLSQAKLAALADLDPSTVSQIETGARRANTRTLERLAAALGAEVADLFPKEQAPLPLEEPERRAPIFARAMITLADRWVAAVEDPRLNSWEIGGLVDAAFDLSDAGDVVANDWPRLSDEDKDALLAILERACKVTNRGLARLHDEKVDDELRRRRLEKTREHTQLLRSSETA